MKQDMRHKIAINISFRCCNLGHSSTHAVIKPSSATNYMEKERTVNVFSSYQSNKTNLTIDTNKDNHYKKECRPKWRKWKLRNSCRIGNKSQARS